jgi:hypothetical protein
MEVTSLSLKCMGFTYLQPQEDLRKLLFLLLKLIQDTCAELPERGGGLWSFAPRNFSLLPL